MKPTVPMIPSAIAPPRLVPQPIPLATGAEVLSPRGSLSHAKPIVLGQPSAHRPAARPIPLSDQGLETARLAEMPRAGVIPGAVIPRAGAGLGEHRPSGGPMPTYLPLLITSWTLIGFAGLGAVVTVFTTSFFLARGPGTGAALLIFFGGLLGSTIVWALGLALAALRDMVRNSYR